MAYEGINYNRFVAGCMGRLSYDNKIVVENAPAGSKLEIYSVVGIRVKEIPMKQPSGEYTVDIAKGYYIVRIGDTVRKVSIR